MMVHLTIKHSGLKDEKTNGIWGTQISDKPGKNWDTRIGMLQGAWGSPMEKRWGGVGWGGVGWGMLPSCSCYVDATLMGGVGWGGACYRSLLE